MERAEESLSHSYEDVRPPADEVSDTGERNDLQGPTTTEQGVGLSN